MSVSLRFGMRFCIDCGADLVLGEAECRACHVREERKQRAEVRLDGF